MSLEQFTDTCIQIGFAIGILGAGIAVGIIIPIIGIVLIYKTIKDFR